MIKQISWKEMFSLGNVLVALVVTGMAAHWLFVAVALSALPDVMRMPFHLGEAPDYLGPKIGFILLPLILSIIVLLMAGFRMFPAAILIPKPITKENGHIQYRNAGWLMHGWQFATVVLFSGIVFNDYRHGMGQPGVLGLWFILLNIVLYTAPFVLFLHASSKVKVEQHFGFEVGNRYNML